MSSRHADYVLKTTPGIAQEQIDQLKQIFPECVTEGGAGGAIDFDLLRATLGDEALLGAGRMKIDCRRRHFGVIGVDYGVSTSAEDLRRQVSEGQ